MGTTLDALLAGSLTYKYVVAIEGYSWLLTTAAPAAAVTAWAGTDWVQALGGLFVEIDHQGSAQPWVPFQPGGSCTLRVMNADGADTFGIDTHRKLAGGETYLTATVDRDDTTIPVMDNTTFAASGEAFIGTECFAYAAKGGLNSFTGCTRGRYAALTTTAGGRWAQHHRQGQAANRVSLDPVVSVQPREWIGKWVSVYLHRDIGGVLDTKAQAQLVYAGKIVQLDDDPSGHTVVQLKHVMDTIGETMLGRDQWSAHVLEGVYAWTGQVFTMVDWKDATSAKNANILTCVGSGASGSNQFNEGYYTLGQICDVVNRWFSGELQAGRIYGTYSMATPVPSSKGLRTKIYYTIPNGAGITPVQWQIRMPALLARFMGFTQEQPQDVAINKLITLNSINGSASNEHYIFDGAFAPLRAILTHAVITGKTTDVRMAVVDETGTFIDQFAFLPSASKPVSGSLGLQWGLFSFNDANYMVAAKVGAELRHCVPAFGFTLPGSPNSNAPWSGPIDALAVTLDQTGDITVKQVIALDTTFNQLMARLFYGSGTNGFNHPAFDSLGYGLGLGIPGSLLGPLFDASVDALPGSAANILMVIEKPTKFSELVTSDLVLRWAFPRWRQGTIAFATWSFKATTPPPLLSESTKARPAGTQSNDRAATSLSEEWVRDIVTFKYNRDALSPQDYLSQLTFEDATHVDDSGGEGKPVTINARNTYGQFVNTGAGFEEVAPNFLANLPLLSRPVRKQTTSISPALYEQLAPGDLVNAFDAFARDPATGHRGIFGRLAIVTRIRYNRGGAQAGNPQGIGAQGEVDLLYSPDASRFAPYSYAATVDSSVSGGGFTAGYNSGTLTLRCITHDNSEASEPRDASRFASGDKILIIERDPANSGSPILWSRTIASTPVNDDIVITLALSAPAFDATKSYRIIYDHFAVLQVTQQLVSAQADDADALIENLAPPFQYTQIASDAAFTAYDPTIPVELVPDACYGDGKAFDVGHEFALAQLAHVLEDYRTAHHSPVMFETTTAPAILIGAGFELLLYWPVQLTAEPVGSSTKRSISVAPHFRSATGASVSIRVSLCREPPQVGDTLVNIVRPTLTSEATFTTTSTTFATPAAQLLDESVKDSSGDAWVIVEGTLHVEVMGLAQFDQGPRQ